MELSRLQVKACLSRTRDTLPADLESLAAFIGDCKRCRLSEKRARLVVGGNPRLAWCSSARGWRGRRCSGKAFVGEAGKLLTKIIETAWASSGRMFIFVMWSNAAANNRDP